MVMEHLLNRHAIPWEKVHSIQTNRTSTLNDYKFS